MRGGLVANRQDVLSPLMIDHLLRHLTIPAGVRRTVDELAATLNFSHPHAGGQAI